MPFLNGKQPLVKKQCIEKALLIRIALCVQEVGASGCLGKGRGDLWLTSVGFFQTQSIGSFFLFFQQRRGKCYFSTFTISFTHTECTFIIAIICTNSHEITNQDKHFCLHSLFFSSKGGDWRKHICFICSSLAGLILRNQ